MVYTTARFPDIQTHWARAFIENLAQRNIIKGFEDGTFRPNQSITRAEFAALMQATFPKPAIRPYVPFVDVPTTHWARTAIQKTYETGFLSGYPNNQFQPNEKIIRAQVLVSLVNGLGINKMVVADLKAALPTVHQDAAQIPAYATEAIAAATSAGMIVNYPDLKRLNPAQAATRAEVAALLYQTLVYLGQAPVISSNFIVNYQRTAAVSHTREFRGVWVTSVWNRDWPSASKLSVEQQKAEFVRLLDQFQALNINAVILQVRPEGDALYASQLEPWSSWLTGTQGKAPEPFYDPLEFAIAQCHQRNMEFHAWFNPYRARTDRQDKSLAAPHIAVTHPEAVLPYGDELWMDPGAKVVQDLSYNVILDVVRRYDVDGIHLDDYFYPYPIANQPFPDEKTYQAYQAKGGTLSLGDWRRENVNQLIQRLATGIRATKRHVKFGISPFGIYRPGQPPKAQGLDAYDRLYADALKWMQQGWADYLAPQLYWRIDAPAQSYPMLLQWWTEQNSQRRHIYIGNHLSKLDSVKWPVAEVEQQIAITRSMAAQLALGNIFFSAKPLLDSRLGITDTFKNVLYTKLALAPAMTWLSSDRPSLPINLKLQNGTLTWSTTANSTVRSWTLYQQSGETWTLQRILPADTKTVTLTTGTYALCTVDRLANESAGVLITVK
ncbi:family 10 glycosylhydrolase [Trichocoleus desertorum AS-A10]|uniref:glycoside hydrolase family 10 protein n=1 Tax=Trichocoleus desertorum TaxID=1481672 RepID=UPI0032998DBD